MIAEVVFNLPLERAFHYLIPPSLEGALQPGMRVVAPFGPRERIGMCIQLLATSPIRALKPIRRILDPIPVVADERWALARWLCDYYGCSLGEALAAMVPSPLRLKRLTADAPAAAGDVATPAPGPELQLSAHQQHAFAVIQRALRSGRAQTLLLYGVTASGKTELYLRATAQVCEAGGSALCLVPEIALTPQTIDRFRARFGALVGMWHSRLTQAQRATEWQRMSLGTVRVVVGARSAVFAPLPRLRLIILDEEHEGAFKQEDAPRYHAREVARQRARLTHATVLLGSATPSVETYYGAQQGAIRLLRLPERIKGRTMPTMELVDMREELGRHRRSAPLSARLERALTQVVEQGEQAMLLLNRRGFARQAQCQTCAAVVSCRRCAIPLIYHATAQALICHYCNWRLAAPELCPQCRKGYLRFRGMGTERVESELHRIFPGTAIARMDRDTMQPRDSHRQVYDAIAQRRINLLVGTQMIAKGFDFPEVTLVGVVSADTSLNLPDFRAGERTFTLLTQMAGRAGRGSSPGRVIIQTYNPHHYAIEAARSHDAQRFYDTELAMRRRLRLPPFVHLIELTLMGASGQHVEDAAQRLAAQVRHAGKGCRLTVMGPAPHRVPRLRRSYRWCLILKGASVEAMTALLRGILQPSRRFDGLPVIVDVDPL